MSLKYVPVLRKTRAIRRAKFLAPLGTPGLSLKLRGNTPARSTKVKIRSYELRGIRVFNRLIASRSVTVKPSIERIVEKITYVC